MQPTYLVQRLRKKPANPFQAKVSQVFGGENLGLKPEAWQLLQQNFDLDPMGAAEYEFSVIPDAIAGLIHDRDYLITYSMTFTRSDVKVNFQHEHLHRMARHRQLKKAREDGVKPPRAKPFKAPAFLPRTIYVICREQQRDGSAYVIRELALDRIHTKRDNNFANSLDPVGCVLDTIGWLELNNGFFFFLDKEAFEGTKKMLMGEEVLIEVST